MLAAFQELLCWKAIVLIFHQRLDDDGGDGDGDDGDDDDEPVKQLGQQSHVLKAEQAPRASQAKITVIPVPKQAMVRLADPMKSCELEWIHEPPKCAGPRRTIGAEFPCACSQGTEYGGAQCEDRGPPSLNLAPKHCQLSCRLDSNQQSPLHVHYR